MYNPLKKFKIVEKVKEDAKKKGFKGPPSMPSSATPIAKMKNLHKNPGK
jgi:hypothetical protein